MSYDGGCGNSECGLCKADAEAARIRHEFYQAMESNRTDRVLCSDCPPIGYPTDKTRCDSCPRFLPLCPDSPDGNHHVAPIGSDEEWIPSKTPCYYCGDKQVLHD